MPKVRKNKIRQAFTVVVLIMATLGYIVFLSAVLGQASQDFPHFVLIAVKQFIILIGGLGLFFAVSKVPFNFWRKYALILFMTAIFVSLLTFIPGLGLEAGGARRWLIIGGLSFQPAELLKFAFVIYAAAWLTAFKYQVQTIKYGLVPLLVLIGLATGILALQKDTGTIIVIITTGAAMFLVAGGKWRHFILIGLFSLLLIGGLIVSRPYIMERMLTYLNPNSDLLGSSYQINQSLIAIGSGGITGRGFGQSVQKFSFLPQPIGDSIFSVAAEEFGLIGAGLIIMSFIFYALWGLKIASRAANVFGRLLAVGLVILVISQSFINIGAMIAVFPLTGIPLIFFSQGGTALLFALLESGIIRNIAEKSA
ncbi:MAG: FtsW/RodA/SpoVE family cell cycle protein [Candidatus Paceibacterota bacterium]